MRAAWLMRACLARREQQLLDRIVVRLPSRVTPDHLTKLGVFGACMTGVSFGLCNLASIFLLPAIFGLFLNWFGDSLDGRLARQRHIERPRYGFLIDHSTDLVAHSIITIGLGCSPYFTLSSALFVLSLHLLMSCYAYLRIAVEHVYNREFGSFAATEFRLAITGWAIVAQLLGPSTISAQIDGLLVLDVTVAILTLAAYALFIRQVSVDLARIEAEENDIRPRNAPEAAIEREL